MYSGNRVRCLIADNDENVLINLEHALEEAGFAVTTAWSGGEALKRLWSSTYDVLVLDDFLSDMSGIDVLQWVMALKCPPLVLVTTHIVPPFPMIDEFLRAGAAAVVRKCDTEAIVNYVCAMSASCGQRNEHAPSAVISVATVQANPREQ
jgi:DNA-binding response OmpR family regulator